MTMFALVSAGGSPGVTTAALALTLSWPSRVILAECDPSGGDVLAGLLGGHLPASTGLLPLALEAGAGTEVPGDTLWRQLIELDTEHSRLLLAGISDPRQSAALQSSLPWIAEALQGAAADVIADCGRLDSVAAVRPVLSAASLAVLVVRPTLRQLSRAVPRAEMLTSLVGRERVVALLAGAGGAADREAAKALGIPVAGHLADDGKTAAVLSDGAGSRSRLQARPLLRSATAAGRALRDSAAAAGPRPGTDPVFRPYDDDSPAVTGPGPGQQPGSRPAAGQSPPDPAAARLPALRMAAFGPPAAGPAVLPDQPEPGPPMSGQLEPGPRPASPPAPGRPGSAQSRPDWPGLAGAGLADAGLAGAGPPLAAHPGRPGLPGRPLRTPDQPGTPDMAAEWRKAGQPDEADMAAEWRKPGQPGTPDEAAEWRKPGQPDSPDSPDQAADWCGPSQPDSPGRAAEWRKPGLRDRPDQAAGWPAPGWPEDDWPDERPSGSGWFGSGGRHAAGRPDDTGSGRGTPADGTPPGRVPGARYLSAYPGPAATPNGSTVNGSTVNGSSAGGSSASGSSASGGSANGSSAGGDSPGGPPNGRSPLDGPAGSSGGTGGGR